jgi:hypothetical protein
MYVFIPAHYHLYYNRSITNCVLEVSDWAGWDGPRPSQQRAYSPQQKHTRTHRHHKRQQLQQLYDFCDRSIGIVILGFCTIYI